MAAASPAMDIKISDVTGQKQIRVQELPTGATVRELVQRAIAGLGLVRTDESGRPLEFRARLERSGRHLHDSEVARDALETGDALSLHPKINAGR